MDEECIGILHTPFKTQMECEKGYDALHRRTHWGLFFGEFKKASQRQLQKKIEWIKNEMNRVERMNPHERCRWVKRVFRKTDEECAKFLHKPRTRLGFNDPNWIIVELEHREVLDELIRQYIPRVKLECREVVEHYERLSSQETCIICGGRISRANLSRHQKTKRCMLAGREAPPM
jgi:hypothetical protein